MSAGFFFLRSSRGADADEGAAAAAPAGFRLAPAPLAKDAKGFRPGPPRVVMGPRERGLKEMESADIVWNGGGTTTDGSRRKDRKNDRRLGAFSSSISLTLFFSCEEQKETERERERAIPLSQRSALALNRSRPTREAHQARRALLAAATPKCARPRPRPPRRRAGERKAARNATPTPPLPPRTVSYWAPSPRPLAAPFRPQRRRPGPPPTRRAE